MTSTFEQYSPIDARANTPSAGYTTDAGPQGGNLSILQFPLDIGVSAVNDAPQQSHYMVFYINEVVAGNYAADRTFDHWSDTPVFMESGSTHSARMLKTILADNNNSKNTVYSAMVNGVAGVGGAIAGGLAGAVVGAPGIGAAIGAGAALGVANSSEFGAGLKEMAKDGVQGLYELANTQVKRTIITVVLPMPEQIGTSYDPNWTTDDAEITGNILGLMENGGIKAGSIMKSIAARIGGSAFQNVTQRASNPRSQMLFQGMNFRNFTWTWTLYPRNKDEAKALWDIIEFLKYHTLPEYDEAAAGIFLIQPSLFDIEFHSHGQRNDYLPKTLSCVCKNISVDYAPAGTVAFFEPYIDPKTGRTVSAPIGVRLSLSFEENEILTKNRIDPKGNGKYNFNQGSGSTEGTF
jgi:hypothetical protein